MRRRIGHARVTLALVAAWGACAATAGAADEKDVVGTWKLSYKPANRQFEPVVTISKGESGLKGEFVDGGKAFPARDVRFEKGKLRFTVVGEFDGDPTSTTFEGEVKGDAIEGEAEWSYAGMERSFPFKGKREAPKPEG